MEQNGVYVINLDEYAEVGTHWIALFCRKSEIFYFDSFSVQEYLKKLKNLWGIKTSKQTFLEYSQIIK